MNLKKLRAKFPVVVTQNLIWRDMDAYRHINNAVYFRYFEDARIAYFLETAIDEHMVATGIGPILASTQCDFRAPLTFPDTIHIGTSVVETWSNRFRMEYVVFSEDLERVAAEGVGLVVYFDYKKNKSCDIPERVRASINSLQKTQR